MLRLLSDWKDSGDLAPLALPPRAVEEILEVEAMSFGILLSRTVPAYREGQTSASSLSSVSETMLEVVCLCAKFSADDCDNYIAT